MNPHWGTSDQSDFPLGASSICPHKLVLGFIIGESNLRDSNAPNVAVTHGPCLTINQVS
jgi:hypothetical protein